MSLLEENSKVRIKDKAKQVIAESLDNTASVGQIMNFLESRCRMIRVYKYVSSLSRQQRRGYHHKIFEHFILPGHPLYAYDKDWLGGLPSGYFKNLSHISLMPQVVTEPRHIGKEDPVAELLMTKQQWITKTKNYKIGLSHGNKRKASYQWVDDNVLHCPKFFVDAAEHLENDPDPHFDSLHNWYYSGGGNMQIVCINGSDYIIHSDLNCLNISQLFKDTMSIDHKNMVTYKCEENIFETIQQQNFIALREKHKVTIIKITETEGIKLEKVKVLKSELPYTSISFDENHKNILYATTLDYMLFIVNLDRMTKRTLKLKGKFLKLTNNWSSVIGSEREYFVHITANALTFYDKRTNEPIQRWKNLKNQADLVTCNEIHATRYCHGKPQAYVGTTHHVFLLDMRYSSKTKPNSVIRWTHGMRSKLTHMDIGSLDDKNDLICMTSHWGPDMCMLSNSKDILDQGNDLKSVTLPYRPPDLLEVYNKAQRKGLCTNLYEPVIDRLMMAVTGLQLIDDDSPKVLVQNSLGDIMCYLLYPRARMAYIEDDGVEQLHKFTKKLKWEVETFEATRIYDLSRVWNSLKEIPDTYELGYLSHIQRRQKYNDQDIFDTFEKQEVDVAFLEAWKDDGENEEISLQKTVGEELSLNLSEEDHIPTYRPILPTNELDLDIDMMPAYKPTSFTMPSYTPARLRPTFELNNTELPDDEF